MTTTFFIRMPFAPEQPLQWLQTAPADHAQVHSGTLAQAASACGETPAVVFVPASRLVLLRAAVPTRNRSRMLQAVPYALEEQLAEDVDQLHFAVGSTDQQDTAVATIARQQLDDWLDALRQVGITPEALVPDVLALPWREQRWTVWLEPEQALVRTGPEQGWATEPDNLLLQLQLALDTHTPQGIDLYASAQDADRLATALAPLPVQHQSPPDGALSRLAAQYRSQQNLNLLQGSYGGNERTQQHRRRWAWVGVLAVLLVVTEFAITALQNHRLGTLASRNEQKIEQLFRTAFPDIKRVVDPKVQMQQQLQKLQSVAVSQDASGSLLALLQLTGPVLAQRPQLQLQGLHYRNHRLDLELNAQSFQALDEVKQALSDQGLQVEIDSASAQDAGVSGRLRVQRNSS